MKKIIAATAAACMLISMSACQNAAPKGSAEDETALSGETADASLPDAEIGCEITLNRAYAITKSDLRYIIIETGFKNNSDRNLSFDDACNMQVFSNGVELFKNTDVTFKKYDVKLGTAKIQPGYEAIIYTAFDISGDMPSSVAVECASLTGGEDIKNVLSVENLGQETTETTTASAVVVPAPAPPAAPPAVSYDTNAGNSYVAAVVYGYIKGLCTAVNTGNYSYVSDYIASGSPLESMQTKLVADLYKNGTEESFVSADITDTVWSSDYGSCTVYVTETENIYYSTGKSEQKTFYWKYTAVNYGGVWKLTNIQSQ